MVLEVESEVGTCKASTWLILLFLGPQIVVYFMRESLVSL